MKVVSLISLRLSKRQIRKLTPAPVKTRMFLQVFSSWIASSKVLYCSSFCLGGGSSMERRYSAMMDHISNSSISSGMVIPDGMMRIKMDFGLVPDIICFCNQPMGPGWGRVSQTDRNECKSEPLFKHKSDF